MNKNEFIEILSKNAQISKNSCEKVLNELKNTLTLALKKGEEVSIKGFGKFKIVDRKARRCVNPITKRQYFSKPKKVTIFQAYDNFKYIFK